MSLNTITNAIIEACQNKLQAGSEFAVEWFGKAVVKLGQIHSYLQTNPRTARITGYVDALAQKCFDLFNTYSPKVMDMGKRAVSVVKSNPKTACGIAAAVTISAIAVKVILRRRKQARFDEATRQAAIRQENAVINAASIFGQMARKEKEKLDLEKQKNVVTGAFQQVKNAQEEQTRKAQQEQAKKAQQEQNSQAQQNQQQPNTTQPHSTNSQQPSRSLYNVALGITTANFFGHISSNTTNA